MLSWRKDSADISDEVPTFHVRYIGATQTFVASGKGCTTQPLQRLWDNAPTERHLRRVAIQFSLQGIHMKDLDAKKDYGTKVTFFCMEDISFCAAEKTINDRLFCWISKNPISGKLEVHAVICSTRDKAQTMASVLSRAFQLAYKDWKAERQREQRKKFTCSVVIHSEEDGSSSNSPSSSFNGGAVSSTRKNSADGGQVTKTDGKVKTGKPPD